MWRPRRVMVSRPDLSPCGYVNHSVAAADGLDLLRSRTGAARCAVAFPAVQKGSQRLAPYQQSTAKRRTFVRCWARQPGVSDGSAHPQCAVHHVASSTHAAVTSWLRQAHDGAPSGASSHKTSTAAASWGDGRVHSETPDSLGRWQRLPEGVWRDVLAVLPPPAACNFALVRTSRHVERKPSRAMHYIHCIAAIAIWQFECVMQHQQYIDACCWTQRCPH